MSPSRSILLVGEGNFSFSSSVCKLDSESGSNITATCLQHQEEALRHDGAAANIQTIEDSGTESSSICGCCSGFYFGLLWLLLVLVIQEEVSCLRWIAQSWGSAPS